MIVIKKNPKSAKKCVIKQKLKFVVYKNYLELTQLGNEIKCLGNNKLGMDSLSENHKEFMKNKRLIIKSLQRIRTEKHNVFTGKVKKIALNANNDKRIQLINSMEIHVY